MSLLWLPAADRDSHGGAVNAWSVTRYPKGVLHTTESRNWPSYANWTVEPHATIMPVPGKGVVVRQHIPFSSGGFALRNTAGGVQTNKAFAFQFELVGTSDVKGPGYFWPNADDAVLRDLWRKVIKPLSVAYGMPVRAPKFKAYPSSYGTGNGVRFTGAQWVKYSGWCGHQHVPENLHGDPGAFPFPRITAIAAAEVKAAAAAKPAPKPPAAPAPPVVKTPTVVKTPPRHAAPEPTPAPARVTTWVYAEGDDRLFFPAAMRGTRAALVIDREVARYLLTQGATICIVGGPACTSLGLTWATAGAITKNGKVTAVHGKTYDETGTLALRAL